MNNIYKVIWSKAKNCYVVASEIARSHTKSATGSGKIGGVTRRSLLASLMALSLLCGGLGVASAADVVHVDESATGAAEVYTKTGVDTLLNDYGKKTDVDNNKNNIGTLQTTTTDQGQKIAINTTNIANNTTAIAKKIDTEMANERFAAKVDLTALQNQVTGKVDENTFKNAMSEDMNAITTKVNEEKKDRELKDAELSGRIDTLSTTVDSKVSKTDLNTNYYTQAETNAAIKTAVDDEKNARENAINGEVTERNKAIADAIAREETNRDAAITNAKTELKEKVTAEETNRKEEDAKLEGKITENTNAINNEKTAREAAVIDLSKRIGTVDKDGQYIKKSATNNVSENLKVLDNRAKTNADAIAAEATERKNKDTELEKKITKNSEDIATLDGKVTTNINDLKAKDTELEGKIKTNADDIAATNKRTAGIDRIDAKKETTIEGNVTVDSLGNVTAQGKLKGEVVDAGAVNAGSLSVENASTLKGDVTMNQKLSVTGDTSLGKTDVGGALNVTGASNLQDNVILGTNAANTVTVNGKSDFKAAVEMENGLTVKNGDTKLKDTTVTGNLNVTGTITTDTMIFGDKPTNYTEIDKGHITSKNAALAGDATQQSSSMEFDRTKLEVGVADKDSNGHLTMTADKTTIKNSDLLEKNYSEIVADKDSVRTTVKDEKNNTTSTKSSATEIRNYAGDAAGNKTINVQTATQNKSWAKDKDGNESSIVQTGKDITNTAEKGTIMSKAKDIVNDASGNISNNSQTMDTTVTGKATESYGSLDTTVNGNETHIVKGTKTETVDGKVTENYKAGQATNVTGNQDIHVTGKQTNTVEGGQENIISGGQINNITGDQTTTITGNKNETVTENVTEDYKKNLTTTVGGNEIHDVKGTKTETVEGKLTENFKGGQETNVTGDQTTNVSGTQTINATDINRNASSGMIDTVDNAYGTNKETKVAGSTTTEVSIKGTDESGTYIRGATEARDYIIKGTLSNSETKTAEATSTEITDGNGKTSATIQDKTQISGSVTNGTSSAVSNVKADSIDTAVKEGTNTSLISQKKDSITSAVGNGTTSTVIQQGDKDITIASNGGTVGIVGKDIINNATDEITNTAGIKITDQVGSNTRVIDQTSITDTVGTANRKIEDGKITDTAGDFTVTTDKANGTTFTNAGSTASSFTTVDGTDTGSAQRWTNVKGNEISTGKVEANYVKMDYADVMKDLGVHGNAKIAGKTTTGSLEVTGTSTLKGDVTMENNAIVKKNLTVEGITTTKTLKVTENAEVGGTLKVAKKATFEDSVSIAKDLSVGGDVTANSYKVGDKTYIDKNGIHANGQKITDVADGSISEGSKDAVNGGQLYTVKNDLEGKVNKVGANAAAMANLHPMEFDPDSKWNIAAAIGNYGSETAAALGAFYRPNDDVMVNLSTAFGTGENMVGGGVSVRLGKGGNKLSREENNALKDQVNDLTARMDALLSVLNPNMSKDFPDVPENHWAYEAVSRLAGNDIVQGYPDGEFHGERTMTRYEMAEIIYNALSRGAEAEKELVEEFKPELQAMAASEKATAERAEG